MRTIDILKGWLELSEYLACNIFIGTRPTISEVKNMLEEVEQLQVEYEELKDSNRQITGGLPGFSAGKPMETAD